MANKLQYFTRWIRHSRHAITQLCTRDLADGDNHPRKWGSRNLTTLNHQKNQKHNLLLNGKETIYPTHWHWVLATLSDPESKGKQCSFSFTLSFTSAFISQTYDVLFWSELKNITSKSPTDDLFLFLFYLSTYTALFLALCVSSKRFTFTLTLLAMLPG
jgi:hypothetical protein